LHVKIFLSIAIGFRNQEYLSFLNKAWTFQRN